MKYQFDEISDFLSIADDIVDLDTDDWQEMAAMTKLSPKDLLDTMYLMPESYRKELRELVEQYIGSFITGVINACNELSSEIQQIESFVVHTPVLKEDDLYFGIADYLRINGRLAEAEKLIKSDIKSDSLYGHIVAATLLESSFPKDAFKLAQKVLEKKSDDDELKAAAWLIIGNTYVNAKESSAALEAYEKAKFLFPENPVIYVNISRLYHDLGIYHKGISIIKEGITICGEHEDFYNNLGCCYSGIGEEAMAIKCFQISLELNPNHKEALMNLQAALKRRS